MIRIGRFLPWILAGALAGVALLPSPGAAQQFDHPRAEWRGNRSHRHHPRAFARRYWMERRMEHRRWMMRHRWREARRARNLRHRFDGYI